MEELDYWKKRCLLAEDYINRKPWMDFLEEIKSDIIPPKSKYTK